jgi:hypothetical protein
LSNELGFYADLSPFSTPQNSRFSPLNVIFLPLKPSFCGAENGKNSNAGPVQNAVIVGLLLLA